jgi:putative peptidoglycan lipid II flippase
MGSVAASTVAAGVLGVVSNVLIAARFGRGMVTDAFFMAQSLPLIFGKFFQTGPLQQVVMPIFLEARARGDASRAHRYAANMITVALVLFGAISVLLWIAAPWIVGLIAPGFDGERKLLTIALARPFVPVVLCMILVSLLTAFLNAFQRFAAPEWLARLPSVALIAVMIWGASSWGIEALVWALVAGSLVQLGLLWMDLARVGVPYRPAWDLRQPQLRQTWQRLAPFVISSAAVQMQVIVHRLVTSTQPVGTLSALSYADRIVHFLGAVLGSVSLVLFPRFIQDALASDRAQFRQRLERAVILVSLIAFPVAMSLIVFGRPLIGLLLERGRFDALATQETGLALGWLAIGLFAWGLWDLCKTAAYALQRPAIVNRTVIGVSLGTIALTLTIGRWWGLAGLAVSWGLVPYLMTAGYCWQLRREIPHMSRLIFNGTLGRVAAAAAGMGLVAMGLREMAWSNWARGSGWLGQALALGLVALGALAGYWFLLAVLGVQERRELASMIPTALGLSRKTAVVPATPSGKRVAPVGSHVKPQLMEPSA